MKKINKSRYAILGVLYNNKLSGYQIIKFMEESTSNFWQESDASVYPMLKKLETEGKITAESEFRGKRAKQIYEITPKGKEEFKQWMAKEIDLGTHRSELLLKIFFGTSVDKEIIVHHLEARKKKIRELGKKFAYIKMFVFPDIPEDDPKKLFWNMTLRNGIIRTEAELKWIDECLDILKERKNI